MTGSYIDCEYNVVCLTKGCRNSAEFGQEDLHEGINNAVKSYNISQ